MNTAEKIIHNLTDLPEPEQQKILDFVEFLKQKNEKEENRLWSQLSIESAMRDMESEEELYSISDLKERF